MFGNHWEPAEATIIASRVTKTSGDGMVSIHEFVAEVRPSGAPAFRAVIGEPTISTFFWPPSAGDVVRVKADVKRGKAKFDMDDPQLNSRHRERVMRDAVQRQFDRALAEPVTSGEARPAGVPPATGARDPGERLRELKALLTEGLISPDEYETRRAQVLAGL